MTSSLVHFQDPFLAERRRVLRVAGGVLLSLMAMPRAHAQAWQQSEAVKLSIGKARVSGEGPQLTLPLVAEDGSSVPLKISTDGMGPLRIARLDILAPGNPTPQVAEFALGHGINRLNLATRIRLSESQTVVAVAHTDDGRAYVSERAVRVTTSGCIAPAQSDPGAEMKARVRMPKSWKPGMPDEVLTMISHPMVTGLAADASGNTPTTRIIERFEATLAGQPVLTARFFRSLAANPYLKFELSPEQPGEMRFQWTEDTGKTTEVIERVNMT